MADENVDMIWHTIDLNNFMSVVLNNASNVPE